MKRKNRPRLLPVVLVQGGALLLGIYLVIQLVMNQVSISSKRQQLQALQDQLEAQHTQNAELTRVLDSDNDLEIVERVARDSLGYAKPNERIFVDMSGK